MPIAQSAETAKPLLNGEIIPDAGLVSNKGEQTTLYKLVENKPAVILFYRGNW